jgi:peptide deformylase
MPVKPMLLLGHPDLYKISEEVKKSELESIKLVVTDLHDTLIDFRKRHNKGRAIAAPQISVHKRIVYTYLDEPRTYINPTIYNKSRKIVTIWDDCMSFPEIIVKVNRHDSIRINYRDLDWREHDESLQGDTAHLLQHEVDHLDGILAIKRAVDHKSFALASQRHMVDK